MTNVENEAKEIFALLDDLSEDHSVPKNIRKSTLDTKNLLLSKNNDIDVKVASAISKLEELLSDPNIPIHGRTAVYTIIGKLEKLSTEISKK